jgi:hypothetical protein
MFHSSVVKVIPLPLASAVKSFLYLLYDIRQHPIFVFLKVGFQCPAELPSAAEQSDFFMNSMNFLVLNLLILRQSHFFVNKEIGVPETVLLLLLQSND